MTGNPIAEFKVPLNSASSSLAVAATDVAVTITVATGDGANFPATADGDFWVSVDAEIMLCTSRVADVLTVTRGEQGTSGAAHDVGAAVEMRITQEAFEDIHSNVVTGILQGWAEDVGQNVSIGTLPANAFVWRVSIWVQELFDAGAQTMNVGYDALTTHLVDTFDVSGVDIDNIDDDVHADSGPGIGTLEATARAIEIYVSAAASTTGRVFVAVHYIVADAQPA